jgi:phosphoglycolate phosphatase-like HAD superfamily hydrolase
LKIFMPSPLPALLSLRKEIFPDVMQRLLVLFDNDGTICDTEEVDSRCYAEAIEIVTGQSLASLDWTQFREPTSAAIVKDFLNGDPDMAAKEAEIEREFVRSLERERSRSPGQFSEISGAKAFMGRLSQDPGICVGIATGCFAKSARFKLSCCGLELLDFPHATSSDTPARRDIIALAATRAGFPLCSTVYFGDGAWDVVSTRSLGVPMMGIGRKTVSLLEMGVKQLNTSSTTILDPRKS